MSYTPVPGERVRLVIEGVVDGGRMDGTQVYVSAPDTLIDGDLWLEAPTVTVHSLVLDSVADAEWARWAHDNSGFIKAIKYVRQATGASLRDAKDAMDRAKQRNPSPAVTTPDEPASPLPGAKGQGNAT